MAENEIATLPPQEIEAAIMVMAEVLPKIFEKRVYEWDGADGALDGSIQKAKVIEMLKNTGIKEAEFESGHPLADVLAAVPNNFRISFPKIVARDAAVEIMNLFLDGKIPMGFLRNEADNSIVGVRILTEDVVPGLAVLLQQARPLGIIARR